MTATCATGAAVAACRGGRHRLRTRLDASSRQRQPRPSHDRAPRGKMAGDIPNRPPRHRRSCHGHSGDTRRTHLDLPARLAASAHGGRCPGGVPDTASPRGRTPKATGQDTEMTPGSGRAAAPRQDTAHPATGQPDCPRPGPTLLTALRPPRCSPKSRTQGLTADPPSPRPLPRSAINPPARPERLRPEPTPGTSPRGPLPSRGSPHHERHLRQDPTGADRTFSS
jgi:hypothetical protein